MKYSLPGRDSHLHFFVDVHDQKHFSLLMEQLCKKETFSCGLIEIETILSAISSGNSDYNFYKDAITTDPKKDNGNNSMNIALKNIRAANGIIKPLEYETALEQRIDLEKSKIRTSALATFYYELIINYALVNPNQKEALKKLFEIPIDEIETHFIMKLLNENNEFDKILEKIIATREKKMAENILKTTSDTTIKGNVLVLAETAD